MGLFDDVSSLVGKGLDVADKKTQIVKAQSQLAHIEGRRKDALADLGRAVLLEKSADPVFLATYATQLNVIAEFDQQTVALEQRIKDLQETRAAGLVDGAAVRAAVAQVPLADCPFCGSTVNLTGSFCASCGKSVALIKEELVKCPQCERAYGSDVRFCEVCGVQTVPFDAGWDASARVEGQLAEPNEVAQSRQSALPNAAAASSCTVCGSVLESDAAFCGTCGASLR